MKETADVGRSRGVESWKPFNAGQYVVFAAGATDGPGDCDAVPGSDPQCQNASHGEHLGQGWSHSSCYAGTDCEFPLAKKPIDDLYDGTNDNPATPGQCYNCNEIEVQRVDPVTEVPDGKASMSGQIGDDAGTSDNWLKFCRGIYDDTDDGLPTKTCSNAANLAVGDKPFASKGAGNMIAWGALTNWTQNSVPNPAKAGELLCFVADLELHLTGTNPNDPTKITNATLIGDADIWVFNDKARCSGKKKKT